MTAVEEPSTELIARADRTRARPSTRRYKERGYALIPRSTLRLCDVGAGTGDDALAIAELLTDEASIVGVDARADLVAEARRRARNVALGVEFRTGHASALPFEDASLDVVRADFALGELEASECALREAARVLRPGGLLLVHDRADGPVATRTATLALLGFDETRVVERFSLEDGTRCLTFVSTRSRA